MKFITTATEFKNALSKVDRITDKRNQLHVLGLVLIKAEKDIIIFKGTNLDIGIEYTIRAKVITEGECAISGAVVISFLSALRDEKLEVNLVGGALSFIVGPHTIMVKTSPHDDFPNLPQVHSKKTLTLSINDFIDSVRLVSYAGSISTIKPEITSVYFYTNEKNILFVATDSFRLAEKKINYSLECENISAIIPLKNIHEIVKIFEGILGDIVVNISENQISFKTQNIYITSRLISGVYPNYRQIVPTKFKTEVSIKTTQFISTLKSLLVFTDKINQLNIQIVPEKSVIELSVKNNDLGEGVTILPATISGEGISFTCNVRYLLDAFISITEENTRILLNEYNKPFIVQGSGNQKFLYLVMPMNR